MTRPLGFRLTGLLLAFRNVAPPWRGRVEAGLMAPGRLFVLRGLGIYGEFFAGSSAVSYAIHIFSDPAAFCAGGRHQSR